MPCKQHWKGLRSARGDLKHQSLKQKCTHTKGDVEAGTSNVVTGQLFVANMNSHILFDSGATLSFISNVHANQLDRAKEVIS